MSKTTLKRLIAGLLMVVAVLLGVALVRRPQASPNAPSPLLRDEAVMVLPPVPVPEGDPVVGPEGTHPDGYPRRHVDRAAVLALLRADRFEQLTAFLEARQAALEADFHQEELFIAASDAFAVADPRLAPHLDAWVKAKPASFAPWLARAEFWVAVASARRGTAFANKTAASQMADMEQALAHALPDAQRALDRHPRLARAHWLLLWRAAYLGDDTARERERDAAIAACPGCLTMRVAAQLATSPRWGGSHEAQQRLAAAAPVSLNPRFAVLPGYVDLDVARATPDLPPAQHLEAIERACALGDHWEFLVERARALRRLERYEDSARDLARAHELRPDHPQVREGEVRQAAAMKDWGRAAGLLVGALQTDPTSATLGTLRDRLVENIVVDAWAAHDRGDDREAIALLDRALDLDPHRRDSLMRRNTLLAGGDLPSPATLAEQQRRLEQDPDDLRARRTYDASLSHLGRWSDILAMWNAYLAAHPDDARALVERCGTQFQLKAYAPALADAERACALGAWEGCDRAQRIRPHVNPGR